MRKYLKVIKYHYLMARLLQVVFYPVLKLSETGAWLKKRLKVNGCTVQYQGQKLVFPRNVGVNVASRIYWFGNDGFESRMGPVMATLLRDAHVLLDVGSNFGFYSVLAQKLNAGIATFCFEPVDHLLADNKLFHEANRATRQTLLAQGVSSEVGSSIMLVPERGFTRFLITSATLDRDYAAHKLTNVKERQIAITTLDAFAAAHPLVPFHRTVVKIDVEGHELKVLEGAGDFLARWHPIVFIEIFLRPANVSAIVSLVAARGYRLMAFADFGLVTLQPDDLIHFLGDRNFLLVHESCCDPARTVINYADVGQFWPTAAS